MWIYGQELKKVNYHPAKFRGHRHCGSGDIIFLICHVISQDQIVKGSCDFKKQEPVKVGCHPDKFDSHRYSDNGDIMVLVCHVILQDYVIKGSYDFMGRSLFLFVCFILIWLFNSSRKIYISNSRQKSKLPSCQVWQISKIWQVSKFLENCRDAMTWDAWRRYAFGNSAFSRHCHCILFYGASLASN